MKRKGGSGKSKKDVKRIKKTETAGDLVRMFDDGTEEREETSFMDLPDDILLQIFKFLDFPSRCKLRLNRRLEQLQFCVKHNVKDLYLDIYSTRCEWKGSPLHRGFPCLSQDFNQLEQGFRRLAKNTFINNIHIQVYDRLNEQTGDIIDAVFNFKADNMKVEGFFGQRVPNLPQVNLSTLLTFAQNVSKLDIGIKCMALSAQDLCILRKTMLENNCKLDNFTVTVDEDMKSAFIHACFGISLEDVNEPVPGRIYRATDESVEIYSSRPGFDSGLDHFEGSFCTSVDDPLGCISFLTRSIRKATDESKIHFNHRYVKL